METPDLFLNIYHKNKFFKILSIISFLSLFFLFCTSTTQPEDNSPIINSSVTSYAIFTSNSTKTCFDTIMLESYIPEKEDTGYYGYIFNDTIGWKPPDSNNVFRANNTTGMPLGFVGRITGEYLEKTRLKFGVGIHTGLENLYFSDTAVSVISGSIYGALTDKTNDSNIREAIFFIRNRPTYYHAFDNTARLDVFDQNDNWIYRMEIYLYYSPTWE